MSKPDIDFDEVDLFTALAAGALLILEKVDQAERAAQQPAADNESPDNTKGKE